METFQQDCIHVFSRLCEDYADYYRPVLGHATDSEKLTHQYYTDELRDKVKATYTRDFEYFGYDNALPS